MATINAEVSEAMREAVRQYAKLQTAKGEGRVTISDVVVQALRNAGFEREDVLEALARGEVPEIDVRRRTPAQRRSTVERVQDYMIERGCHTELELQRNLHMKAAEVRRGLNALIEQGVVINRPFDRPVIWHWRETCKCKTAVDPELVKETP
jgi:hypothetical protein